MKTITRKWILTRAFLVLFLLLTPVLEIILVKVEDRYSLGSTVSEVTSKLSYIGKKTFSSNGQIDILFAGPSSVWVGVNARMIQGYLRHVTGRKDIIVENFAHPKIGYEADYFILRDLVARRKVKVIVLGIENRDQKKIHRMARFVWNPLNEAETFPISAALYAEKFLDSLSTILRSFANEKIDVLPELVQNNGSSLRSIGFSEETVNKKFEVKQVPRLRANLRALLLKPEDTVVTGEYNPEGLYFLKKIIALAKEEHIDLYFMHVPSMQRWPMTKVPIFSFKDNSADGIPVLGIPASRFFTATSWEEVQDFFYNEEHLNMNGALGFTQLIFPAMKEIYEKSHR